MYRNKSLIILLVCTSLFIVVYSQTTGVVATGESSTTSVSTTGGSTGNNSSDTNLSLPFFACQFVNLTTPINLPLNICISLTFDDCELSLSVTLNSASIIQNRFSVTQFSNVLQTETCASIGPLCRFCLDWDQVFINDTVADGCSIIKVSCLESNLYQNSIGCFEDQDVVRECFGQCLNDCNFRGLCQNGICDCPDDYKGDDCGVPACPNECSGPLRGQCKNGGCVCNPKFGGDDCGMYIGDDIEKESDSSSSLGVGLGVGIPVGLVGAGLIGFFLWKRRQSKKLTFLELEGSRANDESSMS